jgi:outer membrane receptor protein involved in Fe transport
MIYEFFWNGDQGFPSLLRDRKRKAGDALCSWSVNNAKIVGRANIMTRTKSRKFILTGAASLLALSLASGAAYAQKTEFDIEAQPLAKALLDFNEQSGLTVAAPRDLVVDKRSPAVQGEMEPEEALEKILSGSGLKSNELPTGAYTVTLASAEVTEPAPQPFRVAQLDQGDAVRELSDRDEVDEEARQDVIVVTGTNIRGIAPDSSPVRSFDRQEILNSGASTAQQFIQTLPQNFSGGANESFVSIPGDSAAASNDGNGSSVNLRGLGAGSTLVLLNGRRIAPASNTGGFADVSMIPASAIERIEVLTDGASSIYGADAVAGVTNIVLRDDYEGVEASIRYGTVTQGNLEEFRASLTGGTAWDTGRGLVSFEHYDRDNLDAGDRDFSQGFLQPNDLLPSQKRSSIVATIQQDISPTLTFGGDFLYSDRESDRTSTLLSGSTSGLSFNTVSSSESINAGGNLTWELDSNWFVDLVGSYSKIDTDFTSIRGDGGSNTRISNSELWSADLIANGSVFELPGGSAKIAGGAHVRQEEFTNKIGDGSTLNREGERDVYAVFGELFVPIVGEENAVSGVRRLEVNVSGRYEDYSDFGTTTNPKVGLLYSPVEGLNIRGTYSTSFKAPSLGNSGALDRRATAIPTSFIDTVFGVTAPDPSLDNVVALLLSGTAPELDAEESSAISAGFDYSTSWGRNSLSLRSTYFDIDFEGRLNSTPVPNGQSSLLAPYIAFEDPSAFPDGTVVFFPSQSEVDEVLANLSFPPSALFGADPRNAVILSNVSVTRNLSQTDLRGIDFDVSVSREQSYGSWIFGLDGTYLIDFDQQASQTTPFVSQLNTQFNPIDLNLRGRLGLVRDNFAANVFVNYADSYNVDSTAGSPKIDSWTTVDATISYSTPVRSKDSFASNMEFRLSVSNLLDQNPPSAPALLSSRLLGFDPANASPLNRFVSFEVTKKF